MSLHITFAEDDAAEIRLAAAARGLTPQDWVQRAVRIRLAVEEPSSAKHDAGDPGGRDRRAFVERERDVDGLHGRSGGTRARRERFED